MEQVTSLKLYQVDKKLFSFNLGDCIFSCHLFTGD